MTRLDNTESHPSIDQTLQTLVQTDEKLLI